MPKDPERDDNRQQQQRRLRRQRRLVERCKRQGDSRACAELVELMLPLVRHLARRFRSSGEPAEDLEQAGTVGLIKAIDNYEPGSASVSSYAVPKIVGEIKHHLRDHTWDVHVPRGTRERAVRVNAARRRLASRLGREPEPAELAAEVGMEEDETQEALSAGSAYCVDSLQAEDGPENEAATVEDTIAAPQPALESADLRVTLQQSMRAIPALERRIVALRFWGDLTQREIAPRVGISQVQVSRVLDRALRRMRSELRSEPEAPISRR